MLVNKVVTILTDCRLADEKMQTLLLVIVHSRREFSVLHVSAKHFFGTTPYLLTRLKSIDH